MAKALTITCSWGALAGLIRSKFYSGSHQPRCYRSAACFSNGICLKAVSYHRPLLGPGATFAVDLHWTVEHTLEDDLITFVHLLDRDGKAVAGVNAYPLEHAYRTYEWQPGETIISSTEVDVPSSLDPGAYSFELGMYLPYDVKRLPTVGADNTVNGDRILFGPVKVPRLVSHGGVAVRGRLVGCVERERGEQSQQGGVGLVHGLAVGSSSEGDKPRGAVKLSDTCQMQGSTLGRLSSADRVPSSLSP